MNILQKINPDRVTSKKFVAMIEISRGSKKKYELDKETGLLFLDRILTTAFCYPLNYGFIPLTYCDDQDPLDVFVLSQEKLDPMVLVECRPLGVIRMIDNGALDEKIIATIVNEPFTQEYQNINHIPAALMREIEHFLLHYKDLEHKSVVIEKIEGSEKASLAIQNAILKYKKLSK